MFLLVIFFQNVGNNIAIIFFSNPQMGFIPFFLIFLIAGMGLGMALLLYIQSILFEMKNQKGTFDLQE
jgi:hypothetical protein